MIDLKLTHDGDLELTMEGDVLPTQSVCQAVRIRLLWFLAEWRLGPKFGFPYFEEVLVKTPSDNKIKHLVRETVMSVEEVTDVESINISVDNRTRSASISVVFCTDEATYAEEVTI